VIKFLFWKSPCIYLFIELKLVVREDSQQGMGILMFLKKKKTNILSRRV